MHLVLILGWFSCQRLFMELQSPFLQSSATAVHCWQVATLRIIERHNVYISSIQTDHGAMNSYKGGCVWRRPDSAVSIAVEANSGSEKKSGPCCRQIVERIKKLLLSKMLYKIDILKQAAANVVVSMISRKIQGTATQVVYLHSKCNLLRWGKIIVNYPNLSTVVMTP